MKNYYLSLILLLNVFNSTQSYAQKLDKKDFEQIIHKGIEKSYAASVKIWGIDTVTKRQNSAQFSGVVVDAEGHILTAAHAISPGKIYKVTFTDGKEFTAVGLGRIAYEPKTGRPDVAMIKITDKGTWPIAEMGWSSSLKTNEPCISIAYPTTLNQPFPTIRVGRISNPLTVWGFVESTCKMEPGDSGGPLFDAMGRVVAIHSRIEIGENVNFEIPIDLYRKYWTALTIQKDYPVLPETIDKVEEDSQAINIKSFPELENLKIQFTDFEKGFKENSVLIKSSLKGKSQQILGTLFYLNGKTQDGKSKSFVVTKSSEVGDSISVYISNRKIEATVIARKKDNDLILLQLKEELKTGIKLAALREGTKLVQSDLGKFLISISPVQSNEISFLGSGYFDIAKKLSTGFFGASANFIDQKIILTRISEGSPAAKAGLALKDQITGINGIEIKLPPEYGSELMKYEPGELITIQGVRDGDSYDLPVTLGNLPSMGPHPAYHFAGGRSFRCDGFTGVFAHDAILRPEECGGPVYDLSGKFCGINVARFSRTSCLALSAGEIYEFVDSVVGL